MANRKIEGASPVEVFVSKEGRVIIKSEDEYGQGGEDAIIELPVEYVDTVIGWLREAKEEALECSKQGQPS